MGTFLMILAGIFVAIILVGFFIPTKFNFSRSVEIRAERKQVFHLINNLEQWQKWSAWSQDNDPKISLTYGDTQEGRGAIMRWKGRKMGNGEIEIKQSDPYKELQMTALFNKGVFRMDFHFLIEEISGISKVTWKVSGRTRRGSMAKILGRLIPKWMGKDIATSLNILKHLLEGKLE
jgi:hypothetical protein